MQFHDMKSFPPTDLSGSFTLIECGTFFPPQNR
jgi:hypothetical protein